MLIKIRVNACKNSYFFFFFLVVIFDFLRQLQACLSKCHEVLIFLLKSGCPPAISRFTEFSEEAISFMVSILDTLMKNALEFLKFQWIPLTFFLT